MNENLIDELYNRALGYGYKKSREEFVSLIGSDQEVYLDTFSYASSKGLANSAEEFDALIGGTPPLKKKEPLKTAVLSEVLAKQPLQQKPSAVPPSQAPDMGLSLQDGSLVSPRSARAIGESTMVRKPVVLPQEVAAAEQAKEAAIPEFAKPLISTITPELVGKEEEQVVPNLNYQFGPLGFKFEEAGVTGDYMNVTSPSGKKIQISLDAFTKATETAESKKLKSFIRDNTATIPTAKMAEIEKQYSQENRKFTSDKEVDDVTYQLSSEANQLNKDLQDYYRSSKALEDQAALIRSMSVDNPKRESITKDYFAEVARLQSQKESITERQSSIDKKESKLNTAIGKYTAMKAEQGTWYDGIWDAPLKGVGVVASGLYGLGIDLISETMPLSWQLMGEEKTQDQLQKEAKYGPATWSKGQQWWKEKYIEMAKQQGMATPTTESDGTVSDANYFSWLKSLGEDTKNKFDQDIKSTLEIQKKFGAGEGSISEGIRSFLVSKIGANTEQYAEDLKSTLIGGGFYGALESVPSFLGGGWVTRAGRMFAQTNDAVMSEMEKDPDFKNISEREKLAVSLPVAAVGAALEEFGFRNLIANKGLLNKLTMSVIGKAGAQTTAKTFGQLVKNEVESGLARGTLTIVGGALAEAETGAAQQAAELGIKEIYNAVKDKKMFNTPETLADYAAEIAKAGLQEAIGGFVLGMPSAVAAAYKKRGFEGMDDDTFKVFEAASKDEKIETAFVTSLKDKVNNGTISTSDAKEQLNDYRKARGLFQSMPEGLELQDKKKAMNLLKERSELESAIQGKDEALSKPQRDRIKNINEQLTKISEDAIQKQATDESVLRSQRPELGLQQMVEGDQKPQVPTAGTQAEVTPTLTQKKIETSKLLEDVESTTKALQSTDLVIPLRQSALINPSERQSYTKGKETYNVGDVIDGDKLDELSGGLVGNEPDKKFILVQAPLSKFKEDRETLLKEYEEYERNDEVNRIEGIKNNFDQTPPIPMKGDGLHRIVAAKELGKETILMWQEVSPESVSESYHKSKEEGNNPELVNAVEAAIPEVAVSLKRPEQTIAKAQAPMVQFPTATTTLEAEGTGVITAGTEPVVKGNNADTVFTKTGGFKPDYTTQEILEQEQAPSSRVVSVASNLGTGTVSYTKKGEKVSFNLPFVNEAVTKKIEKLRSKYKAVKGTSKEAKAEKAKISAEINKTAKQQLIEFQNMMTQNLLALYDSLTDSFVAESKQWYVGANRMAQSIAQKYNLTLDQVGGIIAVLSPQNDWFNNVSVSERSIEVMTKYADTKLTKDIVDKAVAYNTDSAGELNSFAQDIQDLFNQYGEVSINELQGQGLSIDSQAAILRAFDQALHSPKVAMTNPNGKFTGFDTTPVRWNSSSEIGKAISIFRNASIENINSELGGGNKVRNFYNNIVDPDSETPYVTADTHALSAALNSPISANDAGGIGLFNGGAEPLYALVKNAYIDAAKIAGIKPREMQSITWEAQRIGINDKNRTPEQKQKTFDYITESRTNNKTPYERATELIARNRSANPSWGKSRGIETQKSSDAIRQGAELRAKQRASDISNLRGVAGERMGAAPAEVGGAVTGRTGTAEGVTAKAQRDYGVATSDQKGISNIENKVQDNKRKKDVIAAIKKVMTTFKSIFPNAEIYIHETAEQFGQFAEAIGARKTDRGIFSYTKKPDGTYVVRIDINLSNATTTTVYHEVAHAVMLKTFGDNPTLFAEFKNKIRGLLADSSAQVLDKFASAYEGDVTHEEWLVEFAAILSENQTTIPTDLLTKIAKYINQFVSTLTNGVIQPFKEEVSRQEVVDFFNQMSSAISRGEALSITEQKITSPSQIPTAFQKVARQAEPGGIESLPGYDRLMNDVTNTLIPNALRRRMTGQEMIDFIKRFVSRSDVYKKADDIQREQLIRQINGMLGERQKAAPSVQRLLGMIKDVTKITMTEMTVIKNRIKDMSKGAKDAKKQWMKVSAELAEAINDLVTQGKITLKQSASVISRFSKVNMFDEASIDRFVDYMSKVFANAEYADKIANATRMLPNARKAVETKLGISKNLKPVLRQLFAVNPNLIPESMFDDYLGLVSMMSNRQAVLTLEESGVIMDNASKIVNAIEEEQSLAYELADMFDGYLNKVLDDDGKVNYAETINQMLSDGLITATDVQVMKKYKSIIFPAEGRVAMTEQELADEKKQLEDFVFDAKINVDALPTREERDMARRLAKLKSNPSAVESLDNNTLKNLLRVIDNINNGFLPHYAQIIVEKMNAKKNSDSVEDSILDAKLLPFSKIYAKLKAFVLRKPDRAITLMFERNPIYYYDQLLGNFSAKKVYNALFDPIAKAYSSFKAETIANQQRIKNAFTAVSNSFNNDGNAVKMSKYKMTAYLLQLEYLSNPDSNKVNPAIDFINATIKKIRKNETIYGELDAKMLQQIAKDFSVDGQIDIDKLYKSFNQAEKKAIATVQGINESLTEKAEYTAGVIRGEKFTPINNYVHHDVLFTSSPTDSVSDSSVISNMNSRMNPSTRAKSLMERTPGAKAINFNIEESVTQSSNSQLMDYYLTEPIRTTRKTLNETEKRLDENKSTTKEQYQIFNALNSGIERAIETTLVNSFQETTVAEEVVNELSRQGYRVVLASVSRFISELTSNISYVLTAGSKQFSEGMKMLDIIMSTDAVDIMKNVKSRQTTRIFQQDTLGGAMIDTSILNQTSGERRGAAKGYVANKLQQIYNNTLKKYVKNPIELTADTLISTPDKLVMRPTWFGSFSLAFEEFANESPDFDLIAKNDEAYMAQYANAIEYATAKADDTTVKMGSTDNPFMGILKGTVTRNQGGWAKAFNNFNNFMSQFLINEYSTARTAIYAAMGNGTISRADGIKLLAAVIARMTVYSTLTPMLANGLTSMVWGDDDEEEDEKTILQKMGQGLASTFTSLTFGRDFGNATKNLINYGVEKMNEKYLDFLRSGDYDPYKDAIAYTMIPVDAKTAANTDAMDLVAKMGGPMGPALKTGNLILEKTILEKIRQKPAEEAEEETIKTLVKKAVGIKGQKEKTEERKKKEIGIRIPFEVLGNLGYIPLYKDLRNIMLKEMYKDLEKGKKGKGDKEQLEKMLLQGYESRTDMRRYDPELYEVTFGENGVDKYLDIDKYRDKLINDEINKIVLDLKDDLYQYTPKRKTPK